MQEKLAIIDSKHVSKQNTLPTEVKNEYILHNSIVLAIFTQKKLSKLVEI